jgi:hypothetical protein
LGLSMAERETIIRKADDEGEWDVYTANRALMRRLDKFFGPVQTTKDAHWYKLPIEAIQIRKPRAKRKITEEQKKRLASQLKRGHKKITPKHTENQSLLEAMGAGR